jgi:pyruvate dehydrogenase E2 component (dihydrolipoamide acetyltransferase)
MRSEDEPVERLALSGMRGVIARTMTASLHEMAQLTLHRRVEVSPFNRLRGTFAPDSRPSVNDLVLAAVARALTRHPKVNATVDGETISRWRVVHLGMAVALDDGLVVPVIRNADSLALPELRAEASRLTRRARGGALTMPEIVGATFTVTNLGGLGVDAFTPIINPPQVAILGVGRVDGDFMGLSLTIDHRALDGADGARFLQDLERELNVAG